MRKHFNLIPLALFAAVIILCRAYASENEQKSIYVAAFPIDKESAIPGSISFVKEGETTYLTLVKDDLNIRMVVKIAQVADPFGKETEQCFDGVYVAKDGLQSVIVTGRIYAGKGMAMYGSGGGRVAIHEAASANNQFSGKLTIHPFILNPLSAEQDGTGQPATRPESKSEDGYKPQPESEGRSQ